MELNSLLTCLGKMPEDDALWLVISDWLEENGQAERAELTRLHRGLRGMPEDDERWAAESRVRALINGGVRPCVPEIVNSIGMRLALIPAGKFWMGSPPEERGRLPDETLHEVTLTRPFWAGVFPVTQSQYQAVMGANPSSFSATGFGKAKVRKMDTGSFPVETVSWEEAVEFCGRLTEQFGESGHSYRLPTEAEWEYVCRGGLASKPFHFSDTLDKTQANFHESGLQRTCAVGSYAPNAFGLHDMHGNVWEWCQDWYGDYPAGPVTDPTGPEEGTGRVIRGGCWFNVSRNCRSAYRDGYDPSGRGSGLGFRVSLVSSGKS